MIPSFHYPAPKVLCLCFLCLFVAIPSKAKPRLHCDAPKYDFGTRISGGTITNKFILTNKGTEPVIISKIKDCCGVKSAIQPLGILPGSNAVCISVDTELTAPVRGAKTVRTEFGQNDYEQNDYRCGWINVY